MKSPKVLLLRILGVLLSAAAMQLITGITSLEGQRIVAEFNKNGEALFYPAAAPLPCTSGPGN